MQSTTSKLLFTPTVMGGQEVRNRIVLPPLTRSRAGDDGVPTELMAVYYAQRAGAGLVISEGTVISAQATAYPRVPGLYTDRQVEGWRPITSALREHGAVSYAQLWHVGRQSHSSRQPDGLPPFAPSAIPITGYPYRGPEGKVPYETPRQLSVAQIADIISEYAAAAVRALDAGFDGVELHAANGYLFDQFMNSSSNRRTDEYGGSVENRLRFLIEAVEAVATAIPAERVGVRFSPSSTWMDMFDEDKQALFAAAVTSLSGRGLAYLHLVEPEIAGSSTIEVIDAPPTSFFSGLFDGPVIVTGGHTAASAEKVLQEGSADLVGFGRLFMANPDLPDRFLAAADLRDVDDRVPRYSDHETGYVDYPTMKEEDVWSDLEQSILEGTVDGRELFQILNSQPSIELHRSGHYYTYLQLARMYGPNAEK